MYLSSDIVQSLPWVFETHSRRLISRPLKSAASKQPERSELLFGCRNLLQIVSLLNVSVFQGRFT